MSYSSNKRRDICIDFKGKFKPRVFCEDLYNVYELNITNRQNVNRVLLKEFVNQPEEMHKKMITDYTNDFIRDILNDLDEYDKVLLHFLKKCERFNFKEYISVSVENMNCKISCQDYVFVVLEFKGFDYRFYSEELDKWGGVEKYIEKQKIKKKIEDF